MATGQISFEGDPQRIVDEIQDFLNNPDQTVNDGVRRLAEAFAEECRRINERLRRCHEHLRSNLWTEAIQLADAEPNLIEATSRLNFHRRSEWDDLTHIYDELSAAPSLLMDVYDELNEAYNHHMPLERLLIRHRLLALKRATLRDRLKVMRLLAERDEQASFWEEDVITFERSLVEEIRVEARLAAEDLNEDRLTSLEQEITGPDWFELPSNKIVKAIRKLGTKVRQVRSRNELPDLTDRIDAHWVYWCQAFRSAEPLVLAADPNWQTTTTMVGQWFADAERCGLLDSDPLFVRIAPIDAEIREREQAIAQARVRQEALEKFQATLRDPKAELPRLEADREELARWGVIPPDLEEALAKRVKKLWWRRNWERVLGVLLFLGVAVAFVVFIIQMN